ncbi:MAG TPA: N-acetylmuramoyl-L-alanine amidase [Candidatus Tumulicola sp.]|nr:N-acetylmuramoyl-L-alanine amidase [Candidatus Tumulicola sp.]
MTLRVTALLCAALSFGLPAATRAAGIPFTQTGAKVYVAGRQVHFQHLGVAYGDPVAPAGDAGLRDMLGLVAAQLTWQPGTRFAAITRADGKLVTFTLGSTAVSIDGTPTAMPFAPFSRDSDMYLPLIPLAKALNLGVRGFQGGYVFVPQILSVRGHAESDRTIVQMTASAPAEYKTAFNQRAGTLVMSFPGFGTDLKGTIALGTRTATRAAVSMAGPPGFPTTTVAISVARGERFAAHHMAGNAGVELIVAKSQAALRVEDVASSTGTVRRTERKTPAPASTPRPATPPPTPTATPAPTASPTPTQTPAAMPSNVPTAQPMVTGSASPAAEPTDNGVSPAPQVSPSPGDQRITALTVDDVATGTRITLTLSGPVSFEWHRLADPDNRYWLDIKGAVLIGPSQTLASTLPFIKEIKVSQNQVDPEHVVRVSITPTQPIDVAVGPIAQSANQMGVEIQRTPPGPDAPHAGIGTISFTPPSPTPMVRGPLQHDLIAIDPGHGGNDPGAINTGYGLVESHIALEVALKVRDELRHLGWKVIMTREGDNEVGDPGGADRQELQARCDVGNAAGARLFLSIHVNSSTAQYLNGTTTYYYRLGDKPFAQAVQAATVASDGIADDGVKRQAFYVVKNTIMPAVLVETAFLSNPHDAALLAQRSFIARLAHGIARGVMDYTGGPQTIPAGTQ